MQEILQEVDVGELKKIMAGKVVIKENDMEPEMMQEVSDAVTGGIEGNLVNGILNIELAAKSVKENLDKKYGPMFHVIIGEGYSFDVTVQMKSLLFMYYNGNLAILVFKSA